MNGSILRRIGVSLIACILFTVIASTIFMNETYGFGFYFIAFLVYGSPAILLIGLPFSILLDKLLDRIPIKQKSLYIMSRIVLYAAAGFIGTWLYFYLLAAISFETVYVREILPLTPFGVIAALLFLSCIYGMDYVLKEK